MASLAFSVIAAIFIGYNSQALQTDVTVSIPEGIISIQGKTSPNAQVKLYEGSNDQPVASIVADNAGNFSKDLPQMSTGVVSISIQAIDTSDASTTLITKQVAVLSHQTSTLTILLPPTVTVEPPSATFGQGTMEFSGQTIPGATVDVTIEPSTTLSTVADSQGNYMVPLLVKSLVSTGIYSFGVKVTSGIEMSDYVVAGSFVISPPTQTPIQPSGNLLQKFVSRFASDLTPPEINYPSENEFVSHGPLIISGRAIPNIEVTIYDENDIIGSVVAGRDGTWQFYFSPYKEKHTIYAKACKDAKCSDNSRQVVILNQDNIGNACTPNIALSAYRFSTSVDSKLALIGILEKDLSGVAYISWGDESAERFDLPSSRDLEATHTYQEVGVYSGYIIINNSLTCQSATYFSVEVTSSTRLNTLPAVIAAILIAVLTASWFMRRLLARSQT